jgi:hypothetical protein
MEIIETIVIKRIKFIDLDLLCDIVDKLKKYNVNLYNKKGEFIFDKFKSDCIKTFKLLLKNNKPVCDFISAVQTIVGIRNITEFMNEK